MKLSGAQILVESLLAQGVEVIFGYPGGAVIHIFDALYGRENEIKVICASHEQGAAHAADGYARASGKTGVVLATSGPGATNLITGIANAYLDSVPMVAITGNVPRDMLGTDGFQEVDIVNITNPIVKHNFLVREVGEIPRIMAQAFSIANSGRKGPVLVDFPKDMTTQTAQYVPAPKFAPRAPQPLGSAMLAQARELVLNAKKPLIYAGGGATFSDAAAILLKFSQQISAPVCVSMMGLSSIPWDYPLYLGMVGMHGTPTANMAVRECDLLITVGARFSDRVVGNRALFAKGAKKIHIDIDAAELSKNVAVDAALEGDVNQTLPSLLEGLPEIANKEWVQKVGRFKALNPVPQGMSEKLTPYDAIMGLCNALGPKGIVVTDVGQHQMWTAQYYNFSTPRTFLSSCGLGAMGFGLGAAIGAKAGMPQCPVALITGDGSFHMNMNELAVAVTHNMPLLIMILDNRVLGMVYQWQSIFYDKRYSSTEINRATDFVKLAEAFGARGLKVSDKEDLPAILTQALEYGGPCVVDCTIEAHEKVFPFIPPGGSSKDAIYFES